MVRNDGKKEKICPHRASSLMANSRKLRALYILTGQIYESTFQPPNDFHYFLPPRPYLAFSFAPFPMWSPKNRYFFAILSIFPRLFSYPRRYISILSLHFIYIYTPISYNK